jgi:hypothetical protein
MKRILIAALALTSLSAFADWSMKSEKELNDLMYLPEAKTISGTTSIDFSKTEVELSTTVGMVSKIKNDSTTLKQVLGYSINDNSLIGITLAQLLSSKTTYTYGAGSNRPNTSADYKDEGFTDPYVNIKERILHQSDKVFDLDLLVSYSPSLGKHKEASTAVKGNAYRGGDLFQLGIDFGKKYSDKSWKLSAGVDLFGKQKSQDATNTNEITETDSRVDINVGFSWQWVFNPTFTLNLNTELGVLAEQTEINTIGDSKIVLDPDNTFSIGVDCIFNISKKFAIDLNFAGKSHSEGNMQLTTISTGAGTTLKSKDYAEGLFSVAAKYEF